MNSELLRHHYTVLSDFFQDKTILVSGATGLIGSHVVTQIDSMNEMCGARIKCIALYRDESKKNDLLKKLRIKESVSFVKCDLEDNTDLSGNADFVIHLAGFSGGTKMHLKDPVKVFDTGIKGTRRLLDYSASHGIKGFLYVSTYEIYGDTSEEGRIKEDHPCRLDTFIPRNSYAEIKRLCESLCCAFTSKYGFSTYSVRLTSTFGSGVKYDDPRFFAEFARCAIEGRNIVLKSHGKTVRSYLDADDAALAFLFVLARGKNCTAYNLTNMNNELSIKDIAQRIIRLSGNNIDLVFDIPEDAYELGMRKEGRTVMDASKIEGIGWDPVWSFDDTLEKLMESMKNSSME